MKRKLFLKEGVLLLIFSTLTYIACTNLQLGQTAQRFSDNMSNSLTSFPNFNPASPTHFSFSVMGDVHIGSTGGNKFVQALQLSQAEGDSFVITAGDNSNTGIESELVTFKGQASASGLTVYPAIGNHDVFLSGWAQYKTVIGRSIYSFNAGQVHIIILDTANGTFGQEQLNWLRADLQANSQPMKLVVMHFPIYNQSFSSIYKLSSDEEATVFKSIMYQYGVQLVVSGHYHGYYDKTLGTTRYLVSGACNSILEVGARPQFLQVTLTNGSFFTQQIFLD